MIYKSFQDIQLSTLGMGNMRLPSTDPGNPKAPIDYEKAHEIIDYAYDHGVNYFDTAYVYGDGDSERCLGECMKKYPRDSFYLATKYNVMANPDYRAVFEEQLRRLQTDHIDFYLIHCLMNGNVDTYLNNGCIEYFLDLKKQGKISYLGFSSHADLPALEKFANHHQWDFAQLQINYYDWNYEQTAQEYKILTDRNIPVIVMEPVRGGRLASLTPETEAKLKTVHSDWSIASWALRFVKTLPNVQVVLSGMSAMDQVKDNVRTFETADSLTEDELKVLNEVCEQFHSQLLVPCTECRYCTGGCPSQINIPAFLKVYNKFKVSGAWGIKDDLAKVESEGTPADCIECGACTQHCPQNIAIPNHMRELAEQFY